MAEVEASEVFVSFLDSANRDSNWSFRALSASVKVYVAAADNAARLLTNVGMLITRTIALSDLTAQKYGVLYAFAEDTAAAPAGSKLRGNKAVFQFSGSGRGFVTSVPGRKESAYVIANGTDIVVGAGASQEVADWITSIEATGLDINGNAVAVTGGYFND